MEQNSPNLEPNTVSNTYNQTSNFSSTDSVDYSNTNNRASSVSEGRQSFTSSLENKSEENFSKDNTNSNERYVFIQGLDFQVYKVTYFFLIQTIFFLGSILDLSKGC